MAGTDFARFLRRLKPGGDPVERHVPDIRNDMHFAFLSLYRLAAQFSRGKRVLDAGCGTGYGDLYLCRNGAASVVGLDVSAKAIAYANRHYSHPNLRFELAGGSSLPHADASLDVVFSSNVIEHVADYRGYLDEIGRVLAPGGTLILITPVVEVTGQSDSPYHITNLRPEEWDEELRGRFAEVAFAGHYLDAYPQHLIPWTLSPLVQRLMVHPIYKSLPESVRQRVLREMAWNPFGIWEGDFEFRPCSPTVRAMGTSMSFIALCCPTPSPRLAGFALPREEKQWDEDEILWYDFWRDFRKSFASFCALFPVLDEKGERLRDEVWVPMPEIRGDSRPHVQLDVPPEGLGGVRVMFATFARENTGNVWVEVSGESNDIIRRVSAASCELLDGAFHDFLFPPIAPSESGRQVKVTIRTEGAGPGEAPTVWTKYDCLKFQPGARCPMETNAWGGIIVEPLASARERRIP